jgi:hypothetical protein
VFFRRGRHNPGTGMSFMVLVGPSEGRADQLR